ncbi:hypothetical protein [Serratia oryzae]|nr:hypothetical protein [Serratia oryzae]
MNLAKRWLGHAVEGYFSCYLPTSWRLLVPSNGGLFILICATVVLR